MNVFLGCFFAVLLAFATIAAIWRTYTAFRFRSMAAVSIDLDPALSLGEYMKQERAQLESPISMPNNNIIPINKIIKLDAMLDAHQTELRRACGCDSCKLFVDISDGQPQSAIFRGREIGK